MRYLFVILSVVLASCKPNYTAQEIVNKSIESSGLNKLNKSILSFTFRDKQYKATRDNGVFEFVRFQENDSVKIKDALSNNGFERFINDSLAILAEKDKNRFSNSVNSVHYFSVVPLGLNDSAVKKRLLESVTIKGKDYYKVEITFAEEGGGDDFDDVFIYWFTKDNFQLDYLAYKYHTNGGGVRFRDVRKEHLINGVRLVDYSNYKPKDKEIDIYTIDKIYESNMLIKVSEINLENINIESIQ